jgi:hypothetical protein
MRKFWNWVGRKTINSYHEAEIKNLRERVLEIENILFPMGANDPPFFRLYGRTHSHAIKLLNDSVVENAQVIEAILHDQGKVTTPRKKEPVLELVTPKEKTIREENS